MRSSSARLTLMLTAALIAGAAFAASASATVLSGGTKEARFKASVKGVQTTTWSSDHKPAFKCDYEQKGSGTERVKFASTKAVGIRAFSLANGPVQLIRGRGFADLPTRGYVERHGTLTTAPSTPECAVGDGDGSYTPPPSDCGRKAISSLALRLQYDPLNRKRITLSNGGFPKSPKFNQCPVQGTSWTTILSSDDRHRTAGESLPAKDVFDRRQGKMIVLGKGVVRSNFQGTVSTTKISWELTLTRVKR
jgi:hypothetical protein